VSSRDLGVQRARPDDALAGASTVRHQFFRLGRSTVAQTPFVSYISRHAISRGIA